MKRIPSAGPTLRPLIEVRTEHGLPAEVAWLDKRGRVVRRTEFEFSEIATPLKSVTRNSRGRILWRQHYTTDSRGRFVRIERLGESGKRLGLWSERGVRDPDGNTVANADAMFDYPEVVLPRLDGARR